MNGKRKKHIITDNNILSEEQGFYNEERVACQTHESVLSIKRSATAKKLETEDLYLAGLEPKANRKSLQF